MWAINTNHKKVSLNDIRSEELALQLSKEDEEENKNDDNNIDEDLALALKISQEMATNESKNDNNNNNNNNNDTDEDVQLALALQMIEEEEAAALAEEYNIQARLEANRNPHTNLRKVQSSQWNQALALENELSTITNGAADANNLMFKGGIACMNDGNILTKHNSLLKSLNNTLVMSEMDYAGDLEGNRLLVNDLGCKSFKSSLQKLNRMDKVKLWKKSQSQYQGKEKKSNSGNNNNNNNNNNKEYYHNDFNHNDFNHIINDNNDNDDNDDNNKNDDDDDDDDDDYYNRLQEAAPNDDYNSDIENINDNDNNNNNDNIVDISEESYFNRLNETIINTNDDNVVPENDLIWQSLLRQNISNDEFSSSELIHIPYDEYFTSHLLLLQQWAFSKLPLSSAVFRCCDQNWGLKMHLNTSNISSDDSVGAGNIYVDNVKHPLFFMIIKSEYDFEISTTLLHVTLFCGEVLHFSDDNDKLFDIITKKIKLLGTKNSNDDKISITFRALDSRLLTPLDKSLNKHGLYKSWISPCELFVLQDINTNYNSNLPDNYYYSELSINDVSIINDTWAYKSKTSFDMIKMMIQCLPCIGIKYKNPCNQEEILVSWSLTYDYGAIGMLFTLENHRGKGLGQAVIKKLIPIWIDKNYGMSPFSYITRENLISKRLFISIGFQKINDQNWIGYSNNST